MSKIGKIGNLLPSFNADSSNLHHTIKTILQFGIAGSHHNPLIRPLSAFQTDGFQFIHVDFNKEQRILSSCLALILKLSIKVFQMEG
jgi:hypothetical protein